MLYELRNPGFRINRGNSTYYDIFEYQNFDEGYTQSIALEVRNGIVETIETSLIVFDYSPRLGKLEESYSLKQILLRHGSPSRVYASLTTTEVELPEKTIFTMWLFYDDQGILFFYYGTAENVNLNFYETCPNIPSLKSGEIFYYAFFLVTPEAEYSLEQKHDQTGLELSTFLELEAATGLRIEQFYELITTGGESACFSTPRDIWP